MISINTDLKPHYSVPSVPKAHVAICYRNFQAKSSSYSHVGLGINSIHTGKVLRAAHVRTDVFPVWEYPDIVNVLRSNPTITHMVIEAPFVSLTNMTRLVNSNSNVEFTCRTHSQIAFLQVEAGAIQLIRDYIRLQAGSLNFKVSVNSDRLGTFLNQVYNADVLYIPNLYYTDITQQRVWHAPSKLLKIGSYGAVRLMKNHITAAAAALMIAVEHKKDLQFYLSVNRVENGTGVIQSIVNMFNSVPYANLIQTPWTDWPDFRNIIANLDLHMQLSMSETFNITTADAACAGIPTCSSEALDWVPQSWVCDIDNASEVAQKGWHLLNDQQAGKRGLASLQDFNKMSLSKWLQWLSGDAKTMTDYFLK
jgi:hypothetical protein